MAKYRTVVKNGKSVSRKITNEKVRNLPITKTFFQQLLHSRKNFFGPWWYEKEGVVLVFTLNK